MQKQITKFRNNEILSPIQVKYVLKSGYSSQKYTLHNCLCIWFLILLKWYFLNLFSECRSIMIRRFQNFTRVNMCSSQEARGSWEKYSSKNYFDPVRTLATFTFWCDPRKGRLYTRGSNNSPTMRLVKYYANQYKIIYLWQNHRSHKL